LSPLGNCGTGGLVKGRSKEFENQKEHGSINRRMHKHQGVVKYTKKKSPTISGERAVVEGQKGKRSNGSDLPVRSWGRHEIKLAEL